MNLVMILLLGFAFVGAYVNQKIAGLAVALLAVSYISVLWLTSRV